MERDVYSKRVNEILHEMTIDEKLAQLGSVWVYELFENGKLSIKKMKAVLKNGIGQISRIGGATDLLPYDSAIMANEIQTFLKKETRLGIPAMVHEECLNGYMAKGATIFPQMIGISCSWKPETLKEVSSIIRTHMRAVGAHQGLSPVLDVLRDPRWGRTEETFGEDVYMVSIMSKNYIEGLQGEKFENGIMATAKHFVGYSAGEGGMNWAPAHIPQRELREVYLKPFEIAVKEAKVASLMNAYHEIDGVPCGASKELLTDILRNEWGFDGIVVSDYFAIDALGNYHHISDSRETSAKLALNAGIDIELPSVNCYGLPLKNAFERGMVSEEQIDEVVGRILKSKFKFGLFDENKLYVNPSFAQEIFDTGENRQYARKVARESIVLLKNNGILPLKKDVKSIAIIGPSGKSERNLLSDYSFPSHIESLIDMAEHGSTFDTPVPESGDINNTSVHIVTVFEGIKNKVSNNTLVEFAQGCDILDDNKDGFDEAVKLVKNADVAIAVVGDKSGLILSCTTGESRDRSSLILPGVQEDLILALCETGTPIILVLVNGRPVALGNILEKVDAIIEAWFPGEEGGNAISDIIFGDYNPGGKLTISFPVNVGQIPVYYSHKSSGGRSHWHGEYVESPTKPLFPFGYGLSYTNFEYSDLKISPSKIENADEIIIEFTIKNSGEVSGDEVVQLYTHDIVSTITRPVKELKGFKRVNLDPGEEKKVTFTLSIDQFAFYDANMKLIIEPGIFEVMIGSSSEDLRLNGKFEIIGKPKEVVGNQIFFPKVKIN